MTEQEEIEVEVLFHLIHIDDLLHSIKNIEERITLIRTYGGLEHICTYMREESDLYRLQDSLSSILQEITKITSLLEK